MSDREFGGSDDLSLPKATVQKIISEILPSDLAFAKDARDLLIECCVEFITLISSEANEIAEKEAKKTIASEHVVKALNDLGFNEYIEDVQETAQEHKETQKVTREKKQTKFEASGLSPEELLRQQEELFGSARAKIGYPIEAGLCINSINTNIPLGAKKNIIEGTNSTLYIPSVTAISENPKAPIEGSEQKRGTGSSASVNV